MRTVNEVSKLSNVSIRTLHYYDNIGLLPATAVTEAGYRLYDDDALVRLQCILLFKELEFSLKEIKVILTSPDFDRKKALEQQITLLELRKEHLQNLIELASGIKMLGENKMNFDAFNKQKLDEYATQAKAVWGKTEAYQEAEQKAAGRSKQVQQKLSIEMMEIFAEFGKIKNHSPSSPDAIAQAQRLQQHITDHYYHCSMEIFQSLGVMYAEGGEFTTNIDKVGGEGTAAFVKKAIDALVHSKS
ncbi:MAG: MerR family transcriptional regulator [Culicoidibacterales bacterium]